jgi:hypothetical protein
VDGTAKLARGNVGATSQDIFTIDTGGGLNVSAATATGQVVNLGQADTRYSSSMPNFTASTASALISATLGTGKVDFRNAVLTTGTPVEYTITSALTLVMNSAAASLGATTAVATSLIYAIVYNAGNPQLAVCNLSGGLQLDETNLITTTAIGAGSTANNAWYSTTAITTASQYRIIGRVDATWISGTGWSSPTLVQPVGVGQAMQNFSNSLTSSGYQKLPSGLIIQWGKSASFSSESGQTVTFPIAFPNVCLNASATVLISSGAANNDYWAQVYSLSQSSIGVFLQVNGGISNFPVNIFWFAIGY